MKKIREDAAGSLLSFSHAKELLMKVLIKSIETFKNQIWGLMLANNTPTQVSTHARRSLYAVEPRSADK